MANWEDGPSVEERRTNRISLGAPPPLRSRSSNSAAHAGGMTINLTTSGSVCEEEEHTSLEAYLS